MGGAIFRGFRGVKGPKGGERILEIHPNDGARCLPGNAVRENTVRITIALQLQRTPPQLGGLSPSELHRFEGIFVYFGFLLLLFVVSERGRTRNTSRLLSLSVFPLLIYYLTTLGIPLANSAYRQKLLDGDFREHFVFVLLTPLILMVPVTRFEA